MAGDAALAGSELGVPDSSSASGVQDVLAPASGAAPEDSAEFLGVPEPGVSDVSPASAPDDFGGSPQQAPGICWGCLPLPCMHVLVWTALCSAHGSAPPTYYQGGHVSKHLELAIAKHPLLLQRQQNPSLVHCL